MNNQQFETLPVIVPQRLRGQGFLSTDTATVLLPVNIWTETFKDYAGELDTQERALKFVTAIGEEPLEYDITRVDADHINKIGGEFVHVIPEEDIIGSQILSQDGEEILTLVIRLIYPPLTAKEELLREMLQITEAALAFMGEGKDLTLLPQNMN